MGCLNILHDAFDEMSNEDIQDLINTAMSTGNHMINLLNDILNISKERNLSHSVTLEEVKFSELASEPIDNLITFASGKQIDMKHELNDTFADVPVVTDRKKYVQIISNIINNAIKFSEAGRIHVKSQLCDTMLEAVNRWGEDASTHAGTVYTMKDGETYYAVENAKAKVVRLSERNDKKWILASVADSGCGMKPTELGEMLKPYTQSSRGSNRAFQGSGLGLFICVSLCHQLDGFIACSSTPGVGSVFHVGIPVGIPEDDESTLPADLPTVLVHANPP